MTRATVTSILADRDARRSLHALAELVDAGDRQPFERRPPVRGMLGALAALQSAVELAGIWKFLAQGEGSAFHEAVGWCREIGAERAVEYLEAVAAMYPRGQVPGDSARRYALIERIERRAVRTGEPNALRALDRKHRGATDDMARKVRAWARSHVSEIDAVIPTRRERGRGEAAALSAAEDALRTIERMAAERDAIHRKQQAAPRASSPDARKTTRRAADAGTVAIPEPKQREEPKLTREERRQKTRAEFREWVARDEAEYGGGPVDPRIVRFYDALPGVTKKQWVTIATRLLAKPVRYERAYERISEAVRDAIRGDLMSRDEWMRRSVPAYAVRRAADVVIARLPETVRHAGKALRLSYLARRAANGVCSLLLVYDEIAEQETAMKAAKVLLEPFEGIVTVL